MENFLKQAVKVKYTERPEYKFFKALRKGNLVSALELEKEGCNFYKVTETERWTYLHKLLSSTSTQVEDRTPLDTLEFLIEHGLDVNAVDRYGYTPLIFAVRQQNLPAIKLLLVNGAEKRINHCPEDGSTSLKMVFKQKPYSPEIVKTLLEAGADPDEKEEGGCSFRYLVSILADMPPEIPELLKLYPEK